MPDEGGEGVRGRDYGHSAWNALTHEEAVRAEGARYRPARLVDRPQLSEREAACQPQHSIWDHWTKTQPSVVVGKSHTARPGRASPAKRREERQRQADLFE